MVRNTTFQSHARQHHARQHPDPIRILAISVSIALNAAAIALLVRPPEFTLPQADVPSTQAQIIDTRPIEKPKDPLPIVKPHSQPVRTQVPVQHQQNTQVITRDSTPVSTVAHTHPDDTIGPIMPDISPQPVEASLNPIAAPAPTYPRDALRDGITGKVELELLVGVDGSVLEVRVVHSSGNRQLDNAAREQVLRNWRFQPAMRGGIAVQALGRVPIVFSLDGH